MKILLNHQNIKYWCCLLIGLFLFYETSVIFKGETERTENIDISEVPVKQHINDDEDITQEANSNINCLQECTETLQNPKPQVTVKRFSLKS